MKKAVAARCESRRVTAATKSDKTRADTGQPYPIQIRIIGFILVTLILMFFMGATNAIFVAMSVPLSSFIAFLFLPTLGFTLNMMVLFSFLLALGIVVDDAIVVIENTHRIFDNGKVPIKKAAKFAAGEVFLPVFSGTMVVLAPFFPLMFWPGVIGGFMFFLPVTLIVTLLASLFVAYIINPVFAVDFMEKHEHEGESKFSRGFKITTVIFAAVALMSYVTGAKGMGNFVVTLFALYALHKFFLASVIRGFQTNVWPRVQNLYMRMISRLLVGWGPALVVIGIVCLFIFSIWFTWLRAPKVEFFPKGDPNFVFTYVRLPIGTDQRVTDSVTHEVEKRVTQIVGKNNPIVESIISNVAVGANENQFEGNNAQPHLGKVTVAFVKFSERHGKSSRKILDEIRASVKEVKGAEISVDQEAGGPPTGKPVNIEISSDDFVALVKTATRLKHYLDSLQVPGVEELKSDFDSDKPEIAINIDREKANREGISTGQIGALLRTAIYGKEISRFRDQNDDYPIQLRIKDIQHNDINTLLNVPITFRDMTMGGAVRQVPLSAVASISYSNSFAGIRRIDQKRVITLSSNVLSTANANQVVSMIKDDLTGFNQPDGVTIKMTGEQEDQKETSDFLGVAFGVALGLIFMILVLQFNSISKPIIILSEILFSVIGVLIGFSLFKMTISIVMSGVGIMALSGIVVRNGILLVEFIDLMLAQGMELRPAIVEASKTRMTPVLLTAMAATLGLVPLAVGFNIDFVGLFSRFDPHIFFGGDNVAFWGPLSWTMIFGLIFGTMLTLVLVPVLYLLRTLLKDWIQRKFFKPTEEAHSEHLVLDK